MNIQIVSDLHLRNWWDIPTDFYIASTDILILAGDIMEYRQLPRLLPFFEKLNETWKTVLYVPGNHEFYNANFHGMVSFLKKDLEHLKNIHVLSNERIIIDDVLFVGSTLWTDMNKNNPITVHFSKSVMHDFRLIRNDATKSILTVENTIEKFIQNMSYLNYITSMYDKTKTVVITHHAPSLKSIAKKFENDPCNGAFASDLSNFILDNPQIKLWVHGHTHTEFDYMIGDCRVICHPKGYDNELYFYSHDYRPIKIIV